MMYYLLSGMGFFVAAAFGVPAALLCYIPEHKWFKRVLRLLSCAAVGVVGLSATPLPLWLYVGWGGVWLLWVLFDGLAGKAGRYLRLLLIVSCLGAIAWELPYHRTPDLSGESHAVLYVVGDSISAGIGRGETVWPDVLAETRGVQVRNLSEGGAKVAKAAQRVDQITGTDALVLLEIGGNDMFEHTPPADFERDMDRLLAGATGKGRTVVMMELPLIPGANRYGLIQRRLAAKYDVKLIPKRYLAAAMDEPGGRFDFVHLNDLGHKGMADLVWGLIGPALKPTQPAPPTRPAGD